MLEDGEYQITSVLHPENSLAVIGHDIKARKRNHATWDIKMESNGLYTVIEHGNQNNGALDYIVPTKGVMGHRPHGNSNQRWTFTTAGGGAYVFLAVNSRYQRDAYDLIDTLSRMLKIQLYSFLQIFTRVSKSMSAPRQTALIRGTNGT